MTSLENLTVIATLKVRNGCPGKQQGCGPDSSAPIFRQLKSKESSQTVTVWFIASRPSSIFAAEVVHGGCHRSKNNYPNTGELKRE